jgi:hypothetical protein
VKPRALPSTRALLPELRAHVEQLAAAGGVAVELAGGRRPRAVRGSQSRGLSPRIVIPEIRGQVSYFTALHELGHLLSPGNRSLRQLEAEADAWRFALAHAQIEPTAATAARLHASLLSYLRRAERRRALGHRNPALVPGAGSPFWAVLEELRRRAAG